MYCTCAPHRVFDYFDLKDTDNTQYQYYNCLGNEDWLDNKIKCHDGTNKVMHFRSPAADYADNYTGGYFCDKRVDEQIDLTFKCGAGEIKD